MVIEIQITFQFFKFRSTNIKIDIYYSINIRKRIFEYFSKETCQGKCCWTAASSSSDGTKISGVAWPLTGVTSIESCAQKCSKNAECNGFHYYGPNDRWNNGAAYGHCYIKQGVTGVTSNLGDGRDRYGGICNRKG